MEKFPDWTTESRQVVNNPRQTRSSMHRIARISPLSLKDLRCPLCQVAGGRDASRHHPPSPDPGEIALREYRCRACGKDYTTEERAVAPRRREKGEGRRRTGDECQRHHPPAPKTEMDR